MCLVFCTKLVRTISILRRTDRGIIVIVLRLHVKCPLVLLDFSEIWGFSTDILQIFKYQILYKSVEWEPNCCMRTDRQTDMSTLIVTFRNFANAPKKLKFGPVLSCQGPYVCAICDYISHHTNDHCIMGQGRVLSRVNIIFSN